MNTFLFNFSFYKNERYTALDNQVLEEVEEDISCKDQQERQRRETVDIEDFQDGLGLKQACGGT